eukprot:7433233-Pyramimonas_sp.AAC.1
MTHRYGIVFIADWSKYYETIPLELLKMKFLRHGAPTCWLKLVFHMWLITRVIRLGRHHSDEALRARLGLPAGDAYADLAVKVNTVDAFDMMITKSPTLDFQNYIDDSGLHYSSSDYDIAKGTAVEGTQNFFEASRQINATLNAEKLAIISTHQALATAVCDELELPRSVIKP